MKSRTRNEWFLFESRSFGTENIGVVDPDSETLWIGIRIGNPDPDPGARK
jgi:hypothetical protein